MAELFGDAPPSLPSVESINGAAGKVPAAQGQADTSKTSAKIDSLRRKREAREALLEAAAARGISLDELREMIADGNWDH